MSFESAQRNEYNTSLTQEAGPASGAELVTSTPVVLFLFNRPDTTAKVFESIRAARPRKLYLIADGPRPGVATDTERCWQARVVVDHIDWDVEVVRIFSDTNLGCGLRIKTGIDAVFENEESAIILEDDCLPHPDFFRFCDSVLKKYWIDSTIFAVSGTNYLGQWSSDSDYLFSQLGGNWGWATWKRSWDLFKWDISDEMTDANWETIAEHIGRLPARHFHKKMAREFSHPRVDIWDYQWLFRRILMNGRTIVPTKNLVSNIGFGPDSTHTVDATSVLSKLRVSNLSWPLRPPTEAVDQQYDKASFKLFFPSKRKYYLFKLTGGLLG